MKFGRITGNALKRSLLQQIKTKRDEVAIGAGLGEDCAVFSFAAHGAGEDKKENNDRSVIITCGQEGFLSEEILVSHLIQRCENVLASRGGEAVAVALRFLLPESAEEDFLRAVMADAEKICEALQIQIAEAGGRVAKEIAAPYATVTAYGVCRTSVADACENDLHAMKNYTVKAIRPGQDIVLSKWVGLEGTAVLAKRHRQRLLERYPSWLVEEAAGFDRYLSTVSEAKIAAGSGVCAMQNLSEGGILAALWELAEGAGVGLTVDLKKIPLCQETVEVCNHCGINPYELLSGGSLLMTCEDGEALTAALAAEGIPAAIVGKITDGNDRLIRNEDEVRYLDRPATDGVYLEIE